jgi:hexosaminidase
MVEPEILPDEEVYIDDVFKVGYKHKTGSLFSMVPEEGFKDILPNKTRTIEYKAEYWAVSKSDFLPNWYITAPTLQPRVIKSTNSSSFAGDILSAKQWKRFKYDRYNPYTSQDRYERFYTPHKYTNGPSIVPTPKNFLESRSFGQFTVDDTWTISADKGARTSAKLLSGISTLITI